MLKSLHLLLGLLVRFYTFSKKSGIHVDNTNMQCNKEYDHLVMRRGLQCFCCCWWWCFSDSNRDLRAHVLQTNWTRFQDNSAVRNGAWSILNDFKKVKMPMSGLANWTFSNILLSQMQYLLPVWSCFDEFIYCASQLSCQEWFWRHGFHFTRVITS